MSSGLIALMAGALCGTVAVLPAAILCWLAMRPTRGISHGDGRSRRHVHGGILVPDWPVRSVKNSRK